MSDNLKRNYVRRKKYLNDSYETIKQTLEFIRIAGKLELTDEEIHKQAIEHAQAIEAACWNPHLRLTAKEYEDITSHKTKDLCYALTQKYIPTLVAQTLKQQIPRQPILNPPSDAPEIKSPQVLLSPKVEMPPKPLNPSPSFPIPVSINRPQTPHAFPIPMVPRSAPSAPPPLFNDDFIMNDMDIKPDKLDYVPSFDATVDPFMDNMDDYNDFDDPLNKMVDLPIGNYDNQFDRVHTFE